MQIEIGLRFLAMAEPWWLRASRWCKRCLRDRRGHRVPEVPWTKLGRSSKGMIRYTAFFIYSIQFTFHSCIPRIMKRTRDSLPPPLPRDDLPSRVTAVNGHTKLRLPFGYGFFPTDEEIMTFLRCFVADSRIFLMCPIHFVANIYSTTPVSFYGRHICLTLLCSGSI